MFVRYYRTTKAEPKTQQKKNRRPWNFPVVMTDDTEWADFSIEWIGEKNTVNKNNYLVEPEVSFAIFTLSS